MKPVVLIIMDGYGLNNSKHGNAIKQSNNINLEHYFTNYSFTQLFASGKYVGLPEKFQGSSEVGHLNIGAGRIVKQTEVVIDDSIQSGEFFENSAFIAGIKNALKKKSKVHLMGLLQDQGVHAHQEHLFALIKLCNMNDIKPIVHVFSDGRDTPPTSAYNYLKKLNLVLNHYGGKIGTITGRYYAMDRDNRWQRTQIGYEAIVKAKGEKVKSWQRAIKSAYDEGQTDEFIKPRIISGYTGIENNDTVIFFNYRRDRARQLTRAFIDKSFSRFDRRRQKNVYFVAMTDYYSKIRCQTAYKKTHLKNILAKVMENNKLKQLRAAETEKYAHVTYFFNDEIEKPFKKEERILVQSPKISTYDLQPEMSAIELTDEVIKKLTEKDFDLIVINYANCDMVGHTGDLKATIKAIETVDSQIKRVVDLILAKDGTVIITADHGNAEHMLDEKGNRITSHSTNMVPLCIVSKEKYYLKEGSLCNIAPTILEIMQIKKPDEMVESLIQHDNPSQ